MVIWIITVATVEAWKHIIQTCGTAGAYSIARSKFTSDGYDITAINKIPDSEDE